MLDIVFMDHQHLLVHQEMLVVLLLKHVAIVQREIIDTEPRSAHDAMLLH